MIMIYNLMVVVIPTNKEMIRKDWNDQIFRTEEEKNKVRRAPEEHNYLELSKADSRLEISFYGRQSENKTMNLLTRIPTS